MTTLSTKAITKLDALLDAYPTEQHPGTLVGVANKTGEILYLRAVGAKDLDTNEPYEVDTPFWIASCTKLVTSIAAMQLVERGKIGLDEPLGSIVPALGNKQIVIESTATTVKMGKPKNPITLRMLLSHTAGFSYPWYNPNLLNWVRQQPNADAYDAQLEYPLVHEPGTAFDYSVAIDWAGEVVEAVTGQTLDCYCRENIFDPLRMSSATWDLAARPDVAERMGALHSWEHWGGAGIVCTGSDYLQVLCTMINGGVGPSGARILKAETVDLMLTDTCAGLAEPGALALNGSADTVDTTIAAGPLILLPGHRKGWGLCGLLNLDDVPGGRRAGSAEWGGIANLMWLADRQSEIAVVVFNQALPYGLPKFIETMFAVQDVVYDGIVVPMQA